MAGVNRNLGNVFYYPRIKPCVSRRSLQLSLLRSYAWRQYINTLGEVENFTHKSELLTLLGWALFVLNQTTPPQVFTTSYADTELAVPVDYAKRTCNAFAQSGARGISVIFGSGDSGVDKDVDCSAVTDTTPFRPSFPGGCPFFTSVDGTIGINSEFGVGGYKGYGASFSNVTRSDSAYSRPEGNK
ncbi:hypothetical protein M422DRAFT_267567 [Sphaerobolus stellatus SS14]|uniref:Tripeptidyl-peptidase II n=1 Tax=Sphaerobolus stellatus (strain SS14) TaxID=990650 RepID=A0A0C9UZR8_SPHS4|nr:hypothetical protein M422DRAFT_267567 [Sphaerobolus stellatus SS14]